MQHLIRRSYSSNNKVRKTMVVTENRAERVPQEMLHPVHLLMELTPKKVAASRQLKIFVLWHYGIECVSRMMEELQSSK